MIIEKHFNVQDDQKLSTVLRETHPQSQNNIRNHHDSRRSDKGKKWRIK